jgi:hypothetical protein
MSARPATTAALAPSPGWDRERPRYRATRDLWPPSKPHFRHAPPIPHLSESDDIWQYARQPISAGDLINTEFWPHPSFEPLTESARRVHEFFLAGIGKSWLPFRPFENGRVVLDLEKISTDGDNAA